MLLRLDLKALKIGQKLPYKTVSLDYVGAYLYRFLILNKLFLQYINKTIMKNDISIKKVKEIAIKDAKFDIDYHTRKLAHAKAMLELLTPKKDSHENRD